MDQDIKNSYQKMYLCRRLVSKSFLFLYNLFYNINVSDPQIGFKIIKNKFQNISKKLILAMMV